MGSSGESDEDSFRVGLGVGSGVGMTVGIIVGIAVGCNVIELGAVDRMSEDVEEFTFNIIGNGVGELEGDEVNLVIGTFVGD